MKAIVIGATGAVGKELVKVLLSRPDYETVITFTRRPLGIDSPKLESHVIDFDRTDTWEDLVRGDVLFSALGTSLKQAGSKEAQYKIDHDYQLSFARAARAKGVSHFVLTLRPFPLCWRSRRSTAAWSRPATAPPPACWSSRPNRARSCIWPCCSATARRL